MTVADLGNGIYESLGGFAICLSIRNLHNAKIVRGVSWPHVAFFSSWGYWNLFFYSHIELWLSFFGGAFLAAANTAWLGQIVFYLYREKRPAAIAH